MSEWDRALIGEVVRVIGGGTPTRTNPDYYGGDIPWVTPKDMKSWHIDKAQVNITQEGLECSTARLAPANSVLIVVRSGVLKHTLPVGLNRRPVAINQDMKALICSDRIDPNYLARFIKERSGQILQWVRATTADNFPIDNLKKLPIPLPPLDEQRRIAAVLDKVDALRAKRREAIALLDDLTQSVFLDMFGDPATNYKGWPLKRMDSLFSTKPNYGTMTPAAEQGSWLCLRVANIQDWKLNLTDQKYVDLPSSALERHSVLDGDLLLARAIATQEQLGKAIVAYPGDQKWAFDSHLMRIRFDQNKAKPEFVSTLLRTPGGRSLFLKRTRRSSVQFNINTKEISALRIPVPPIDLQREFIDRLSAITSLKSSHRAHLSHLDELFASLQQRAFRGDLFSSEAA